jgi:hypothetical protein
MASSQVANASVEIPLVISNTTVKTIEICIKDMLVEWVGVDSEFILDEMRKLTVQEDYKTGNKTITRTHEIPSSYKKFLYLSDSQKGKIYK